MKPFPFVLTLLLLGQNCLGQNTNYFQDSLKNRESLVYFSDTLIKNEIASFSIKGKSILKPDTLRTSNLIEIPLYYCNDSLIYFNRKSTYIHLYPSEFDSTGHELSFENDKPNQLVTIDGNYVWGTNGEIPQRKIDSVFFVIHSHVLVDFSKTAFSGIFEPNNCSNEFSEIGKRNKKGYMILKEKYSSTYYKVFQAKKGARIYLYMINGIGESQYEVTWIIQNGRYLSRIVDLIN
jgi:hypothetical protein